uniref:RIKEN cDNA 9230102O04 gene n=1 Tax=Mus spicilegus TaxID=10103 RepID=A0A8C6I7X9_MUSSI
MSTVLIGKVSPLRSRKPQPAWPRCLLRFPPWFDFALFSAFQLMRGKKRKEDMVKAKALWIDQAAAAPTHAPRKNSGPGDDQG